jgi:hypothetical protein
MSGFAFTGFVGDFGEHSLRSEVLSYFYKVSFAVAFTTSVYILSVVVITVMFGPTLALKGSTDDAVKYSASQMREIQMKVLKVALIAITALIFGAGVLAWDLYNYGVAAIVTFVYIVIYYTLVLYGFTIYRIFNPLDINSFLEPDAVGYTADGRKMTAKEYREEHERKEQDRLAQSLEATKLKVKGTLWKRNPIEKGGLFVKYYAVLEKGRLDFYAKEKDYRENANPVNSKPIKLWQYNVELDTRKYQQNVTGLASTFKSKMIGHEDFSMADLMSKEVDLAAAARNYKFALVPKVISELTVSTTHEFLAHDEPTYKMWTEAFDTVVK